MLVRSLPERSAGSNQLRCRSARAMLLDNLHEENETALVNEEGGWVGRLARCVPAKPVLVGKRVTGIKHKVEVRRQLLSHHKFRGTCIQVLGRARIDKDHVGSRFGEVLGVRDEI